MSFGHSTSRTPPPTIQRPRVTPDVWCCGVPACPDLVETLSSPEHVAVLESVSSVYQFYQTHLLRPVNAIIGPNSVDALLVAGALARMRAAGLALAVEAPAVKAYTTSGATMDDEVHETHQVLDNARAMGLPISDVVMDEPLSGGHDGRMDQPRIVGLMEQYIRGVKEHQPNVRVGWVEGFNAPAFSYDEPIRVTDRLRERGASPDFLHLDIDWWVCRRAPALSADRLRVLLGLCRDRRLPLGVVVTGHADKGDAGFLADATELFNFLRSTFGADWPERVIVQSWGEPPSATGPGFTVPRMLGASGLIALTQRVSGELR